MGNCRRIFIVAFIVLAVVMQCANASAGDDDAGFSWRSSYEKTIAGTSYSLGLIGGYGVEIGDPPELDIAQVMPFVAFPITGVTGEGFYRGVLEYKIEGVLGYVDNWNTRGQFGLNPIGLRYNFTASGTRFVPFAELTLGLMYINVPKKIQGTRFNFTEGFGVGARFFVSDGIALEVSGRFRHLSNGGIKEPNPGINTMFIMVGISYF